MPITVVDVATGVTTLATVAATTAVVAQAGDLLYIEHANDFYTLADMPVPTATGGAVLTPVPGGTADNGANSAHVKTYTAPVVTAGVVQTVSVTETGAANEDKSISVYLLRGADLINPVDAAANANGVGNPIPAPSVIVANADSMLFCHVNSGNGATVPSLPPPGSMVARYELHTGTFVSSGGSEQLVAAGATGVRNFTGAGAIPYAAVSVAIKVGVVDVVLTPASFAFSAHRVTPQIPAVGGPDIEWCVDLEPNWAAGVELNWHAGPRPNWSAELVEECL